MFQNSILKAIVLLAAISMLLVAFSYNRGGMLAFLIPMFTYITLIRWQTVKRHFTKLLIFAPLSLLIFLLAPTKEKQDWQGRTTGFEQLSRNVTSIFVNTGDDDALSSNKLWRLTWWEKIIDYTFFGPYFLFGKGLGLNLAIADDIPSAMFENLRSPHNFSLNILARYGVVIFFIWVLFIGSIISKIKKRNYFLSSNFFIINVILVSFLINSMFDVYLEGPMAALPFWTFVGFSVYKFEDKLVVY